ncbi:tetratricopeptide repeat protein [Aquabacterium humicola]|uniref:tetratricopeptide repeat protein n=1 Tax=Aquabacterium humicola TaxID=3237377 RepID=UPI002543FB30|nr:tetratricopeptide repeat protein [Rubrivivax pictus]
MKPPFPILPCAFAAPLLFAAGAACSQVIDEVDIRREGDDAVLQVRFATEVQFQRSATTRSGDLTQVVYSLLTTTNRQLATPMQARRLRAAAGVPEIELTDEADRSEPGDQLRRLVLRFGEPVQLRVRAGRGNRAIDVVLTGKGRGLPLPASPAARAAPARPPAPAPAPVPAPAPTAAPTTAPITAPPTTAPTAGPPVAPPAGAAPGTAAAPATAAASPELEARTAELLARARAAFDAGRHAEAIEALNQLLELPPTTSTRDAQELAGRVHLAAGDPARARAELETYLTLWPQGEGSDRVRALLATLPAAPTLATPGMPGAPSMAEAITAPPPEPEVTINGSTSLTAYGGNGQVRSRDFLDSPIAGVPQVAGDPTLSADRSRQLYTDVDLNWRRRNSALEQRFVFRDSYTRDQLRPDKSRNRLSALYFDHRSIAGGWSVRLGRQSPTGGGVTSRFDGARGSYQLTPRLKIGAVAGEPTDRYFDSKRRFLGASVDAERLPGGFGLGVYAIEQRIDGLTDRRAVGLDLRFFRAGTTVFSQFDYDVAIGALNTASVQATLITEDNTVWNALYDRRKLSTLALGNALTFEDPAQPGVLMRRIRDRLAGTTVAALRDQVRRITPDITQAQVGVTKPLNKNWQVAGSVQLTNTGAIPPVPEVAGFENGRPATGDIVTTSAQLIGLNLYSARDTHVLSVSRIASVLLDGTLVSYNNSSLLGSWLVEPTLQWYRDTTSTGSSNRRWSPGLRVTYRGWKRLAVESAVTWEIGRATRHQNAVDGALTTTQESTRRVNYSLGVRIEF